MYSTTDEQEHSTLILECLLASKNKELDVLKARVRQGEVGLEAVQDQLQTEIKELMEKLTISSDQSATATTASLSDTIQPEAAPQQTAHTEPGPEEATPKQQQHTIRSTAGHTETHPRTQTPLSFKSQGARSMAGSASSCSMETGVAAAFLSVIHTMVSINMDGATWHGPGGALLLGGLDTPVAQAILASAGLIASASKKTPTATNVEYQGVTACATVWTIAASTLASRVPLAARIQSPMISVNPDGQLYLAVRSEFLIPFLDYLKDMWMLMIPVLYEEGMPGQQSAYEKAAQVSVGLRRQLPHFPTVQQTALYKAYADSLLSNLKWKHMMEGTPDFAWLVQLMKAAFAAVETASNPDNSAQASERFQARQQPSGSKAFSFNMYEAMSRLGERA